ncbi:putative toxin-antitoxin system toxin component, PIN family [Clostridium lacusfryxellense]|uniref:putative toxin-antitoxin system toxin component, PIN family n=1 Tax=Clostridium lacusfryxellense TaxID=205328 RepID=UPI001C0C256C|nr:putative toxin-antitoxin system toxin component, PIN family [Clostridium lacusfryxellense]MBU3112132.1 putative toxin-antitoxin system toxin component, PIN family [Clostridium lacusfryxellense]
MKVVIDTCAMMAGALGQTVERQVLDLVRKHKIEMIYSQDILTEYLLAPTNFVLKANTTKNVNDSKIKGIAYKLASTMSNFICNYAEKVDVKTNDTYLSDKSDDKVVNLAIDGNAKYIISIDCHLFEKTNVQNKKGQSITAISPFQFIRLYKLKSL